MGVEYEPVENIILDELGASDSVKITDLRGAVRRRVYEVDIFKVTDEHVYGIAFVSDNNSESEMLGGAAHQDPASLRQEYVRFPRHGQLDQTTVGNVRVLPEVLLAEEQAIETVAEADWKSPELRICAFGLFNLFRQEPAKS